MAINCRIFCVILKSLHAKQLLRQLMKIYRKAGKNACLPAKAGLLKQFNTEEGIRFWRGDNKPVELWSNKVIDQKIDYLPVWSGGYPFTL